MCPPFDMFELNESWLSNNQSRALFEFRLSVLAIFQKSGRQKHTGLPPFKYYHVSSENNGRSNAIK